MAKTRKNQAQNNAQATAQAQQAAQNNAQETRKEITMTGIQEIAANNAATIAAIVAAAQVQDEQAGTAPEAVQEQTEVQETAPVQEQATGIVCGVTEDENGDLVAVPKEAPVQETKKGGKNSKNAKKRFMPAYKDGEPCQLVAPKISRRSNVEGVAYVLEFTPVQTEFCRNSVKSQGIADAVQFALVRAEIDRANDAALKLDTKADDKKTSVADAALLKEESELLKAEIARLKKAYPEASKKVPEPHINLIVAGISGRPLQGMDSKKFANAMSAAADILRNCLDEKFAGKGTANFTEEQREAMTELKQHAVALFSEYCKASQFNTEFKLRVLDRDIVHWYEMSGTGTSSEKNKFTEQVRKNWDRELTLWFLGKIYKSQEPAK